MRKFFRYFLLSILSLAVLMVIGFFVPRKWTSNTSCPNEDSISIVIGSNGYHTSFILPVKTAAYDWSNEFSLNPEIEYLEFGWGNQQFYMAKDFSVKATMRALFPSAAVNHVVELDKEPERWFKNFKGKRIYLCRQEYLKLVEYIHSAFELNEKGEKIYLGEGLYGPSSFYKGRGSYHALETCNTWVAEGLRTAEVTTPLWGGTAPAILWHLNRKF